MIKYFLVAASIFSTCAPGPAARAEESRPPSQPTVVVPDLQAPDPELLRPPQVPSRIERDRSERLIERGRVENQRMRLERQGDRSDPRVQDRLRTLDRASDRLR